MVCKYVGTAPEWGVARPRKLVMLSTKPSKVGEVDEVDSFERIWKWLWVKVAKSIPAVLSCQLVVQQPAEQEISTSPKIIQESPQVQLSYKQIADCQLLNTIVMMEALSGRLWGTYTKCMLLAPVV